MIESGEQAPFWLIGSVLLVWAGWDVWTWFRGRRLTKTESEAATSEEELLTPQRLSVPPEKTITEHGILTLHQSGYPKSLTTWDDLKKGKQANHPAGPPPRSATTPMKGIPELERCHGELVKYIAKPYDYPIGQQEIAATQEFLPHVVKLCRILDEQGIPHPPIPRGLTFTGTGEWGRFLADLMAVQHDIELARRVYQDSRSS